MLTNLGNQRAAAPDPQWVNLPGFVGVRMYHDGTWFPSIRGYVLPVNPLLCIAGCRFLWGSEDVVDNVGY